MARPVTEKLVELILEQVEGQGTVVWCDPDATYEGAIDAVETALLERWPRAHFCSYTDERSFLALRRGLEKAMSGRHAPRAVIHLPLSLADTDHALIEYSSWAAVMCPGQQPPECNTALEHVARLGLTGLPTESGLEEVLQQIREGKLDPHDLDKLSQYVSDGVPDALAKALGAGSVPEAVLRFLSEPGVDAELIRLDLMHDLGRLLTEEYGHRSEATTPQSVRTELARYLLVSDAAAALGDRLPSSLTSVSKAESEVMVRRCADLVRTSLPLRPGRVVPGFYCRSRGRAGCCQVGSGPRRSGRGVYLSCSGTPAFRRDRARDGRRPGRCRVGYNQGPARRVLGSSGTGAARRVGRRLWVGRGGAAHAAYLRTDLSAFGFDTSLEYATPCGLGGFKAPGPENYYHGGLSPQELTVPVAAARPLGKTRAFGGEVSWALVPGSAKITSQVFSVTIEGKAAGLFPPAAPKVRVELRAGPEVIGTAVHANYGHESGTHDIQLRTSEGEPGQIEANPVMLLVDRHLTRGQASVHLLNATTGVELARLDEIEIDILD